MRCRVWLAVGLTVMVSLPAGAAAVGQIAGRVIDRTAPPHPVAGQIVRLAIIERGAQGERTTLSDAAGFFRFSGLPIEGIRVFLVSTDYRGVRYTGGRLTLNLETPARTADLSVYEASSDRSAMRASAAFAVVDIAPGALRVSQIQRLDNPSDRTIVISPRDPLTFPLPAGAESVRYLAGWRDPHVDGGGITDAFPLLPGETQVAYAYGLRSTRAQATVSWMLPYGAADVEMLIADTGATVKADGLGPRGSIQGPGGVRYMRWSGGPIPPLGGVTARLGNLPLARDPWPAGVVATLTLVLAAGLAVALRRPAPALRSSPPPGS